MSLEIYLYYVIMLYSRNLWISIDDYLLHDNPPTKQYTYCMCLGSQLDFSELKIRNLKFKIFYGEHILRSFLFWD